MRNLDFCFILPIWLENSYYKVWRLEIAHFRENSRKVTIFDLYLPITSETQF